MPGGVPGDFAFPDAELLFWFCGVDLLDGRVSLALENREYIDALSRHRVCSVHFVCASRHLGSSGAGRCLADARRVAGGSAGGEAGADDAADGLAWLETFPWAQCGAARFVAVVLDAFDLAGAGYPLELIRRCVASMCPGAERVAFVLRFIADTDACWVPHDVLSRVDLVWVPSSHSAAALPAALALRLAVVPEVCRPPSARPPVAPAGPRGDFVFLAVMNDYGLDDCLRPDEPGPRRWNAARKNFSTLLEAFTAEFPPGDAAYAVKLFVKSSRPGLQDDISDYLGRAGGAGEGPDGRIRVFPEWFADIGEFLGLGHCVVAPSRGEGWCRPLAEALRAGIPVIGSSFGGQADYLCEETGYVVKAPLVDCPYMLGRAWEGRARWGEVDPIELRRTMRHVVTHYGEALARALVGQQRLAQRCSPAAVATVIGDSVIAPLLRQLGPRMPPPPADEDAWEFEPVD